VKKKNKWGFVDVRGASLVEPRYDKVWDFVDGVARVENAGLFGAVDSTGREVIPLTNADLSDARHGHLVGGKERYGVYDLRGRLVIPEEHDEIVLINGEIAKVVNGELSAYRRTSDGGYIWKEAGFSTEERSAE